MAKPKPEAVYNEYNQHLDLFNSKLPEEVLKDVRGILRKPVLNRTQEDVHQLFYFFNKIEFFDDILQTYDMWTVLACLKLLSLVTLMPNQLVFQRDEISKCFWVLLNGEAIVPDCVKVKDRSKVFRIGESAGNFEDQMMQFSVKTVLKCEFAVLRKEQYEFVVQKRDENEHKRIMKLLKNTAVFEDFQMVILKKNIEHFTKRTYNYNSIVYDENQPIDGIYIIDSGQFSIMKSKPIDSKKQGKDSELSTNRTFVRLSVLQQQSQVFGQEEVFRAKSHRKNRAICTQNNSKVLFLNIDRYMEIFKSTSNNTINHLIQKEKSSHEMREGIIQSRYNLDQHYKHFLYQSSISPVIENEGVIAAFKHYDPESLAELQSLQVPSTKKFNYLPTITQNSQQLSPQKIHQKSSPERNDHLRSTAFYQSNYSNMNTSGNRNNNLKDHLHSKNQLNSSCGNIQNVSQHADNLITWNNKNQTNSSNASPKNNSKIIIQIEGNKAESFYGGNSQIQQNNGNILKNNSSMLSTTDKQIRKKHSSKMSISNSKQNNIPAGENQDNFMEENEIMEIQQKQKLQNIQEILEKNKHLCQNANFLKDEDILLELQRNKTNNNTLNSILLKNRSKSNKRQSSVQDRLDGRNPSSKANIHNGSNSNKRNNKHINLKDKSFYDVESEDIVNSNIQRSQNNRNSDSLFKPKSNGNSQQIAISSINTTQRNSQDDEGGIESTFVLTQQYSAEPTVIIKSESKDRSYKNSTQNVLPQIVDPKSNQKNSTYQNNNRRRSLKQSMPNDQMLGRRKQNQSFHDIYDIPESRFQHLSYKEQLSKLNKSEEIGRGNQLQNNRSNNQQRQYLSVYANISDSQESKQQFVQYKDILYQQKPSRDVSMTQIFEDVNLDKIKNINLDAIDYQISNQSEIMRQIEHEIQYAITGPKNKVIENYIGKYIKRTQKRKIKEGYEIPSLLDTLKKDNSVMFNNSIEMLNEQYSTSQVQSHVNLVDQSTLPHINQNNSNFKQFMGGIQPQNSINKQFFRKSRKKIKEKLQKAIEDKLLEDQQNIAERSPSPIQQNNKKINNNNNNNNKSYASIIQQNPFISPKSIITTPKLHTIILGIDKFDIVKD